MHKEYRWDNLGEITVRTYDFKVQVYPSIEEAVRSLTFGSYYWNDVVEYGYPKYHSRHPEWQSYRFPGGGDTKIFYTCEGVRIPCWKIKEVYDNLPNRIERHWRHYGDFTFRQGPVPGRGGHKAGRYRGYRAVRTTQQRRESDFIDNYDEDCLELGLKVRAKRNLRNVPTRWHDIRVSHGYYSKNWKKYRSHQWKAHI